MHHMNLPVNKKYTSWIAFAEIRKPAVDVGTQGADGGRRHEIIAFPNVWGQSFVIGVRTILFRGERRGIE